MSDDPIEMLTKWVSEVKTSKHAELLNALDEMQHSLAYAVRRDILARAEQTIVSQEETIARLERELAEARAKPSITLTGHQILTLAEMVGGDDEFERETEIFVTHYPERIDDDGERMPGGLYASYVGYPEEGATYLAPERLERELAEAKAEQRKKDADIARTAKISCFDDGIMFNQACEKIARAIEDQEA